MTPPQIALTILYEEGNSYGGLHCGTGMEVLINDEWAPTRIEYGNDWYLVGVQKKNRYTDFK